MEKFLEIHYLPRLNHEEIEKLNRPKSKEIESVIKKLTRNKKAQDQVVLLVNSPKHLKKN